MKSENSTPVIYIQFTGSMVCSQFQATFGDRSAFGVSVEEAVGRLILQVEPDALNGIICSLDEHTAQAVKTAIG